MPKGQVLLNEHWQQRISEPIVQVAVSKRWECVCIFYKNVVLKKKMRTKMRKARPNTGLQHIHLLQDNAPVHKSSTVAQFLKFEKVNLLSHLPYNPDLALCKFFLFPKLKTSIWYITKTRLYSFDRLKPHFYTVKLGFTGVYINFLISAQKHRVWVLVRVLQYMFWAELWKLPSVFIWKFSFFGGNIFNIFE